jgi:hypothetical protein
MERIQRYEIRDVIIPEALEDTMSRRAQAEASVVFVYVMEAMKSDAGTFTPALLLAIGLMGLSVLLITQLHDRADVTATEPDLSM